MGVRSCVVEGCPSRSNKAEHKGVSFHSFPTHPNIRPKWVTNCRFPKTRQVTKSMLVCSRHFKRSDFIPRKNDTTVYLVRLGVNPTTFPWGELTDKGKPIKEDDLDDYSGAPPITSENSIDTISELNAGILEELSSDDKVEAEKIDLKRTGTDLDETEVPPTKQVRVDKTPEKLEKLENTEKTEKIKNAETTCQQQQRKPIFFVAGAKIEAQDFDGVWHNAIVNEVDNEEGEALIKFESSAKVAAAEEWIPQNSSRLRSLPIGIDSSSTKASFIVGERCLAKWNNQATKYPAVITQVLENNKYQVLYDDGFSKNVKLNQLSKWKEPKMDTSSKTSTSVVGDIKSNQNSTQKSIKEIKSPKSVKDSKPKTPAKWPLLSKESLNLEELNLPHIPEDGEWCCHWVNDQPIGEEGFLTVGDHKKPTVIVQDWRLPSGWIKHMYQRSNVLGKWDVILVSPQGKRFRSKADLKLYLEEQGDVYNPDIYDFSIHRRRAKDINCYAFTKDYKPPPAVVKDSYAEITAAANTTPLSPTILNSPATPATVESTIGAIKSELMSPTLKKDENTDGGYVFVGSLKVQIVDNLFRCPDSSCNKNSRTENHVKLHIKHYHKELAGQLGECPNMEEIAYKRTLGTPHIDEPLPKNHLPNSQFFAKVYQQDLLTRTQRKSGSAQPTPTSSTQTSPQGGVIHTLRNTPIDTPVVLDRVMTTTADDLTSEPNLTLETSQPSLPKSTPKHDHTADDFEMFEQNIAANSSLSPFDINTATMMIEGNTKSNDIEVAPAATTPTTGLVVPEMDTDDLDTSILDTSSMQKIIAADSIPSTSSTLATEIKTKKSNSSRKSNRQRTTKKFLSASLRNPSKIFDPTMISVESEDARHSFNSTPEVKMPKKSKSLQQIQITDSVDSPTGSLHEVQAVQKATINQKNFVNEDGEVIKIVRMRQEEIINCLCSYGEEDGLMIQCELCLCWQHGVCNGIEKESQVPEKYVCYICKNPQRGRSSQRYVHDQDWLYDGKLPTAKYHADNPKSQEKFHVLKKSHTVTGNLLEMKRFLHSLRTKINIASNKDHPKMYLWANSWEDQNKADDKIDDKIDVKTMIQPTIPQPEAKINSAECQLRLLEHIKLQQHMALDRLAKIEAQVLELEAVDNTKKELTPSRTRELISVMIKDLELMKNISKINTKAYPLV